MVRFMFQTLYFWGKGSRYPLDKLRELVPLAGIELQFASCAVYNLVSKLTDRPIFRLLSFLPPSVCV